MMILLITNSDVRNYRQLGKQLNEDNFSGRVREIQENELTELLNPALAYDFFNFLDNGYTNQAGTFTRDSDRQFTASTLDLSTWVGYSVKINDSYFGIVKTAAFGGTDTVITLTDESPVLPDSITTLAYSTETKYIDLLNGTTYESSGKTVRYNGLRPFISWNLLAIFVMDGTIKHSDVGNFKIKSVNFDAPSVGDKHAAKSIYLQNSTREENRIIDYLNEESTTYDLWDSKCEENTQRFNFFIA